MSQVNLDDPKKHSDSNFEVLQAWIDQIMNGQISLDGTRKTETKSFEQELWLLIRSFVEALQSKKTRLLIRPISVDVLIYVHFKLLFSQSWKK